MLLLGSSGPGQLAAGHIEPLMDTCLARLHRFQLQRSQPPLTAIHGAYALWHHCGPGQSNLGPLSLARNSPCGGGMELAFEECRVSDGSVLRTYPGEHLIFVHVSHGGCMSEANLFRVPRPSAGLASEKGKGWLGAPDRVPFRGTLSDGGSELHLWA